MDFPTAQKIIEASQYIDVGMGQIDTIISKIPEEEERKVWAARLGNVMRAVNEEIIRPVVKTYPELDES